MVRAWQSHLVFFSSMYILTNLLLSLFQCLFHHVPWQSFREKENAENLTAANYAVNREVKKKSQLRTDLISVCHKTSRSFQIWRLAYWRLWNFIVRHMKFNSFLHSNEHAPRIFFWYLVKRFEAEPSKIGHIITK